MRYNASFVLLITTLCFIASCASPQKKSTNAPQPTANTELSPPIDASTLSPTATKANQRVLVPTPYVPKPQSPQITQVKKAISNAKPLPKKAIQPAKTKPSKIVKKSAPSQTKPAPTKKKLGPITPPPTKKTIKPTIKKPVQPSVTSALTPIPITAPITQPEISISIEALPLKIGSWTLGEKQSLSKQCNLTSVINNMPDGQGTTPAYLEITQQQIIFHTKSNIDTSYTGAGMFIEEQGAIPIEQLHTPTSVLFDKDYNAIVNAIKTHSSVEIKVGFWPSWPVTHVYATTLKTERFKTAYSALKKCDSML
ncbi:MAG: hypothetical protein KUG73_07020 [Pseudomonadales bacterium]|nr:hypothetical protein [Pseudomonadales bacterium]